LARINIFHPPQQIKADMAYFIGSIMGDGNIYYNIIHPKHTISLASIDLEYCEEIKKIIKNYIYFWRRVSPRIFRRNNIFVVEIHCKTFCEWLLEITEEKRHIPKAILDGNIDVKKAFIEGVMDSEGGLSKNRNGYSLSLAIKDEWIYEAFEIFKDLNIKTSKQIKQLEFNTVTPNGNKYRTKQYYFYIDILSFHKTGLRFIIKRKQKRIQEHLDYVLNR